MRQELGVSERRACRTLGQHRSTQRKTPRGHADEQKLTDDVIEFSDQYRRYGYQMVTGLLNNAGWSVNHKRVERIYLLLQKVEQTLHQNEGTFGGQVKAGVGK